MKRRLYVIVLLLLAMAGCKPTLKMGGNGTGTPIVGITNVRTVLALNITLPNETPLGSFGKFLHSGVLVSETETVPPTVATATPTLRTKYYLVDNENAVLEPSKEVEPLDEGTPDRILAVSRANADQNSTPIDVMILPAKELVLQAVKRVKVNAELEPGVTDPPIATCRSESPRVKTTIAMLKKSRTGKNYSIALDFVTPSGERKTVLSDAVTVIDHGTWKSAEAGTFPYNQYVWFNPGGSCMIVNRDPDGTSINATGSYYEADNYDLIEPTE